MKGIKAMIKSRKAKVQQNQIDGHHPLKRNIPLDKPPFWGYTMQG
jgi:hypothetical protein